MRIRNVYRGGDLRHVGQQHSFASGNSSDEVRYAGHLPRRHFVLDFYMDGGKEEWQEYFRMEGDVAANDAFGVFLLGADTRVDTLVVHNKRATGVIDTKTGAITKPAKVKFVLYDGETVVKETDEIDLSVIGRTVLDFGSVQSYSVTTNKDTDGDGKHTDADTNSPLIMSNGAWLTNVGVVRMVVVDDSGMESACLSAFLEIVDFCDVRGCECVQPACESEYPEPIC